ncbi:MAG: hypothetical protein LBP50_04995 [Tannerella sp.]|jgi:hypothetical protein|nr:hypothetical protein [Tannerella sp.]
MFDRISKFTRYLLTGILGCVCFLGCDIIEDLFDKKDGELSEEEIAQIREDHAVIDLTAREVVSKHVIDTAQMLALIEEYNQLESVEEAWLEPSGIFVMFRNYGLTVWAYEQEFIDPPFFDINEIKKQVDAMVAQIAVNTRADAADKVLPENKKVAIFRSLDNHRNCILMMEILEEILDKSGYDATLYVPEEITVDFLKTALKDYGTIIVAAHGFTSDPSPGHNVKTPYIWIQTGESKPIWREKSTNRDDYTHFRLLNAESGNVYISDEFINHYYENGSMSNTLFYTLSCWGGSHDMKLGKVLKKKRKIEEKGVTIGYTKDNNIGHATAWYLFNSLLSGYTVEETYDILPSECITNVSCTGAKLVCYPETETAENISLAYNTASGSVNITNPIHEWRYPTRLITLSGTCIGFDKIITGSVSIGELTVPLNFVSDSTFSQNIIINSGINDIKVVCNGNAKGAPLCITAKQEIQVRGDFPPLSLFTEMRWNTNGTDVDLHLVGPDGTDCYYKRKETSWGGYLDVDNRQGYGPEHITIPALSLNGVYTLYVHYYNSNGRGRSDVWVDVSTPADIVAFGPHTLSYTGDQWQVCTIDFPSGKISYTGLRSGENNDIFKNLPAKKDEK